MTLENTGGNRLRCNTQDDLTKTEWSTQAYRQAKLSRGRGAGGVRRRNTGESRERLKREM